VRRRAPRLPITKAAALCNDFLIVKEASYAAKFFAEI
jgi:hypothetical protein